MTDLDHLTADQLRALHVTADERTRRAIKRRLQQLADLPEPPAVTTPRKAPQMQESGFRLRFLALRPPTVRPCSSLAQITDALDRTTAEANDKKEGK